LALFLSAIFGVVDGARAEDQTAKVYELGKVTGAPIYIQKTHIADLADGSNELSATIFDSKDQIFITEHVTYNGLKILSQKIENFQNKETYSFEKDGDKYKFSTFKIVDGKGEVFDSSKTETLKDGFITGPVMVQFLRLHWDELQKGDTINARYAVFEVGGTVGFKFKKKGTEKINGKDATLFEMKASSFFISLLIDPIEITLTTDTKKILRYRGRSPLKKMENGKLKPFDAEILYE
jgi:hypothetical protein